MVYKISTVTMAKPLFTINTNRTDCYPISCSSSSSDISFDYRSSANGRTGKEWKKLLLYLRTHLGQHRNMTSAPSHVIDITREDIREGADAVVAVGGDVTLHEVVNGFFWEGKPPLFVENNDPHEAVQLISRGLRTRIDIGDVSGGSGEPHYFLNVADVHLSAKVGYYASKYKQFGNLCYVIGTLRGFMGHSNQDLRIKVNGGDWELIP
ncbi:hypothetical protein MKW98_018673 [Papaver atlanticum]|uniref:DAGKc domain-containing protein n=1 Tax=Papaver atlanticum TaxID=357466 RepID=A0AAD4XQQ3_9MAGN|nr:hypothetical protein MKW98_018673 [Papaver atlanticum]